MNQRIPILIVSSVVFQVALSLQGPIFSVYVYHLTGDLRHLGGIMALYTLSVAASSTVVSRYFLKYKFYFFMASNFLYILYSLLLAAHPVAIELYFIQIYGGFAVGMGSAAFMEIFLSLSRKAKYTENYSVNKLASTLVGSVAAASSGYIAHYVGMEVVFFAMAGLALLAGLVSFRIFQIYKDI